MENHQKTRLLINLPSGFFHTATLQPEFDRLASIADIRLTSHDTIEDLEKELEWPDAIFMWAWPDFTPDSLDKAKRLKFVGHINASRAQAKAELEHGIAVSEVRHAWSPAVAELALGLMLDGLRKISQYHYDIRNCTERWVMDFPADIDLEERQLTGRSVGIVGFGRIGRRLAELLGPFQVKLKIHDPYVDGAIAEKYGAEQVSVMDLVSTSEIVVLCAANTRDSAGILGEAEVSALRKGCVLVNVARSSLINMPALYKRLEKRDMFAMLDVFDMEPLEQESPLRHLQNAYLTPHRGGGIMESIERTMRWLADDLEALLEGREREHALTEQMLASLPD